MSHNRILKYLGSTKRKVAIQPLVGQPEACAFCGQGLAGSHLNAASMTNNATGTGPMAVICSRCIDQLAHMSKLTGWYQRYFRNENFWSLLEGLIQKRLAGEAGTDSMRKAVTAMLVKLTKRACAIIAGQRQNGFETCQKTGVSLKAPRIAFVCSDPEGIMNMVYAGADVVGIPLLIATEYEAMSGKAYNTLKKTKCNGDPMHADNGLLIVDNEFPVVKDEVGVLYLFDGDEDSDVWVPKGVEVIKANGGA